MIVKIGGVRVNKDPLLDKLDEVIKETRGVIESKNRKARRSKPMQYIVALLGFVGTIAYTAQAKAEELDVPIDIAIPLGEEARKEHEGLADKIVNSFITKITDGLATGIAPREGVIREDTLVWKMNEFLSNTLLTTQDFFNNPQIVGTFSTIWYIVMSFTTIMIAKKGVDLTKARVLGSNTIGGTEFIIRMIASIVMTFLSLDIIQLGIEGSNAIVKVLFSSLTNHLVPYEIIENTSSLSLIMWLIAFLAMFFILVLQYWLRQINIVFVSMIVPIANMSWVVDGGAMLSTVIRELVLLLTTPIAHGLVLSLGSIIMLEGVKLTGNAFVDGINGIFIGLSTMILMIITPSFLRKFIVGSVNPLTFLIKTAGGMKSLPLRLASAFTRR